jgi:hypothetical protein
LSFEPGSLSFGLGSLSFELGSLSFELGSLSFELGSLSFELGSLSFELGSLSFELGRFIADFSWMRYSLLQLWVGAESPAKGGISILANNLLVKLRSCTCRNNPPGVQTPG